MLLLSKQYLSSAQRLKSKKDEGIAYFFQGFAQIKRATFQDATVSLLLSEDILKSLKLNVFSLKIADLGTSISSRVTDFSLFPNDETIKPS